MCSNPNCFSDISVLKVNTIVQSRHPVIVFNGDPEFELTFEEDFRIHELLVVFVSQKNYVNSKSSNPGAKRQCPWLFLQPCLSDAQVSWGQKSFNMQPDNSKLYSNSSSDAFWSGVPELHAPLQQSRPVIVPSDGHRRRQALRQNGRQDLVLQLFYIFFLQVGQNIASDGIMRQSLEMYDEYKQVSTTCKHI